MTHASPQLKRFEPGDLDAVARFALDNDVAGLDRFVERALHDAIPIGAILLEVLWGAERVLRRRHEEGACGDGQLSLAIGALRLCALKWSVELPRRSSLDAGGVVLVEPPEARPSVGATFYAIYCDCAGWSVERAESALPRLGPGTVGLVCVDDAQDLERAREIHDDFRERPAALALGPSIPTFDDPRVVLIDPGRAPGFLARLEENVRRSRGLA